MLTSPPLLLFILPFVAYAQYNALHDGPCPPPPPALQVHSTDSMTGKWYAISTNYELAKDPARERKCIEADIDIKDGGIEIETHYIDPNGPGVLKKRYTPIEGQPGRYLAHKPSVDGGWVSHGWVYTLVGVEGDAFLEYACREEGTQHKSFRRIFGRLRFISQEETNKLKEIVKNNGDERELIAYDQTNCQ